MTPSHYISHAHGFLLLLLPANINGFRDRNRPHPLPGASRGLDFMARLISAVLTAALAMTLALAASATNARGDDPKDKDAAAKAVLDKAIKALGGEEKLKTFTAATWKAKGKISFNGNDSQIITSATIQGLDRYRNEFEGEFGGNKFQGVTVLNGEKGWRKFGDMPMEMDAQGVANEKRSVYLQVLPARILPLIGKEYKVETAGEQQVDGKPAVGLKAIGPDGKDFLLYFDKESGLPVKLVGAVVDFMGNEVTQETTFTDYKEFDGVKKATKINTKRDGELLLTQEITEFKILKEVDSKAFDAPKL